MNWQTMKNTLRLMCSVTIAATAVMCIAQGKQLVERKRLTVICYWQNYAELMMSKLGNSTASTGCDRYKDPTHCGRTAPEMFGDAMDAKHDWERVTAGGLIYTIRCSRKCKKIPAPSESYDAETDGKSMWITFERPDNKNLVETFEVFDISPMRDEAGK